MRKKVWGKIAYKDDGWACIEVESALGKYLRRLYSYFTYGVSHLHSPSRGSHVTFISEYERPRFWGVWEGESVCFEIIMKPETNGNAIWFPVESPDLEKIRMAIGLPPKRRADFHYCVGYLEPGKQGNGVICDV